MPKSLDRHPFKDSLKNLEMYKGKIIYDAPQQIVFTFRELEENVKYEKIQVLNLTLCSGIGSCSWDRDRTYSIHMDLC